MDNPFEWNTTPYMFTKKPWRDYLLTLHPLPAWHITEDEIKNSDNHDAINLQRMQDHSPGNYTLEKYYDEYHGYLYRLKFASPQDKTLFLLKYS